MLEEQNIQKKSNSGILRIFEIDESTISNWGIAEENNRKALLKEILEGKYQK